MVLSLMIAEVSQDYYTAVKRNKKLPKEAEKIALQTLMGALHPLKITPSKQASLVNIPRLGLKKS